MDIPDYAKDFAEDYAILRYMIFFFFLLKTNRRAPVRRKMGS